MCTKNGQRNKDKMNTRAVTLEYQDYVNVVRGGNTVTSNFTQFPVQRLLPVRQQPFQRKEKQELKDLTFKHALYTLACSSLLYVATAVSCSLPIPNWCQSALREAPRDFPH